MLTKTGWVGVQLFFVISGFLITYLIVSEFELRKKFDVKNFYIRRALRIWPLYYFYLTIVILILPNISNTFHFCGNYFLSFLFLNNFDTLLFGDVCPLQLNTIAWSVAIEEQFYVFWPLIFLVIFKNKRLKYLICGAILIFGIIYSYLFPATAYLHTFGNSLYLMAGCFGAFLIKDFQMNPARHNKFIRLIDNYFLATIVIFISLLLFKEKLYFVSVINTFLLPFVFLWIVLWFSFCNKSNRSVFDYLGKHTYGMYFYHSLILTSVYGLLAVLKIDFANNIYIHLGVPVVSLLITIIVSIFSYKYFEKRFIVLKDKFSYINTR